MDLSSKISALIKYLDFRQNTFAAQIGMSQSHVSDVINRGAKISLENLTRIIDKYAIDARWFFDQLENIEEADLRKRGVDGKTDLGRLSEKIEALESKISISSLSDNALLREILGKISDWDDVRLGRLLGYIESIEEKQ